MKTIFGKINSELKNEIFNEFTKAWDERMSNYCTNEIGVAAKLPDGKIFAVKKEKIKKKFYFAEGFSREMDEALDLCENATENGDYFLMKNTLRYRDMIELIELDGNVKSDNIYFGYIPRVIRTSYCGEKEPINIFEIQGIGKQAIYNGSYGAGEELTIVEKQAAIMLYRYALEEMEKKCRSYLKKYGTKFLSATTYWDCK